MKRLNGPGDDRGYKHYTWVQSCRKYYNRLLLIRHNHEIECPLLMHLRVKCLNWCKQGIGVGEK